MEGAGTCPGRPGIDLGKMKNFGSDFFRIEFSGFSRFPAQKLVRAERPLVGIWSVSDEATGRFKSLNDN